MVKIAIATLEGEIIREATAKEQAEIDAQLVKDNQEIKDNYLTEIKKIRLEKLKETDWMAMSDLTMSDAWKTKRQAWRDIPQNNSTEAEYEALLVRDSDGNLTHSIWSKP
jgi:hypothetical protein